MTYRDTASDRYRRRWTDERQDSHGLRLAYDRSMREERISVLLAILVIAIVAYVVNWTVGQ